MTEDRCGESPPVAAMTLDARIGLRLSLARRLARIPLTELADKLSWPACLLEAYENGQERIPASGLQAAADLLCLPVSWFFGPARAGMPDAERRARHAAALDGLDNAMERRSEAERARLVAHTIRLAAALDRNNGTLADALRGVQPPQQIKLEHGMEHGMDPRPELPADTPVPPRRVLVVDDAADVLVTTGAFVEAAGYQVIRARDADIALRVLASGERVDAIVTDYAMPTLSGVDLLLLAVQMRPGIPALIITGFADVTGLAELPAGIEVLYKPFRRAQFVAHLNAMLARGAAPPKAAIAARAESAVLG